MSFTWADLRTILLVLLYLIWWPINKLLRSVVYILKPLWTLVGFILLPVIYLANTIIKIITFPFSAQWLERIETVYVYLGTAALVGCMTGAVIYVLFKFISSSLNIDSAIVPQPRERTRTTADYRAARREKKEEEESLDHSAASTPVVLKKIPGSRSKGLLSQAIIEEEDSDF